MEAVRDNPRNGPRPYASRGLTPISRFGKRSTPRGDKDALVRGRYDSGDTVNLCTPESSTEELPAVPVRTACCCWFTAQKSFARRRLPLED